jgi:hypothetical protein
MKTIQSLAPPFPNSPSKKFFERTVERVRTAQGLQNHTKPLVTNEQQTLEYALLFNLAAYSAFISCQTDSSVSFS